MTTLTNHTGIPLTLAVWLAHDDYDYVNEDNYISATSLMKPLRHIILPSRVPVGERVKPDVGDFIARALGHSLHDSIEKSWVKGYQKNLAKLGYPAEIINRVLINPTDEQLAATKDAIPVYLEQREIRSHRGYRIGGKYDMVAEGMVQDNKSTSVYTWTHGNRDDEHALQGSIYRWLNPKRITEDFIRINYIFTDWQKMAAKTNPAYPQKRILYKDIELMSMQDTENWVRAKLHEFKKNRNLPEEQLPDCTDEELWRSDPVFKYYADPTKTAGKSTKNFDNLAEARTHMAEKGKGTVLVVPGEVKRCGYCAAFPICKQKDRYFQ